MGVGVAADWGRVTQRTGQEQHSAGATPGASSPRWTDIPADRDLRRSPLVGLQKGFVPWGNQVYCHSTTQQAEMGIKQLVRSLGSSLKTTFTQGIDMYELTSSAGIQSHSLSTEHASM